MNTTITLLATTTEMIAIETTIVKMFERLLQNVDMDVEKSDIMDLCDPGHLREIASLFDLENDEIYDMRRNRRLLNETATLKKNSFTCWTRRSARRSLN